MNSPASWIVAFVVASATAGTLLVGDRTPAAAEPAPRDPAQLPALEAELILNRIREGDLLAIKGDLGAARNLWRQALRQGAGYWPIHEAVGDSLVRHRLDAEAGAEYDTAATIAAKQLGRAPVDLQVKRAALHLRAKRNEPALAILVECGDPGRLGPAISAIVRESPALLKNLREAAATRDPRLWAIVATDSPDPGDRASALGRFARDVAPDDPQVASTAIGRLREAKKLDEALLVATAWSKAAPSNIDAYDAWGRILAEKGDRDRARLVLSTIVDIKAGDPAAHLRLGAAFRDLGWHDDALRQFEEVSRLRPDEPTGGREILLTLLAKNDFDGAMAAYSKVRGDPGADLRQRLSAHLLEKLDAARKAGRADEVKQLRVKAGELGVIEAGIFDIKIVMKWNVASDVDLDVTEPGGATINHNQPRSPSGGLYVFDNTTAFGPEHYLLHKAAPGKYRVGVHLHGSTPSVAEIEVILFEETPREKRLHAKVELQGKTVAAWPIEFVVP